MNLGMADSLMDIFGFKRQMKGIEMENTKREQLLANLARGREAAKLKPKSDKKLPSLRAAINAQCKACGYHHDNGGGTWRQQISACTVKSCGLYPVRPQSKVSFAQETIAS